LNATCTQIQMKNALVVCIRNADARNFGSAVQDVADLLLHFDWKFMLVMGPPISRTGVTLHPRARLKVNMCSKYFIRRLKS
jgi:hypothetical protein